MFAVRPVSEQPLHGLCCRKMDCAGRVKRRHGEVKSKLLWQLKQVEGIEVKVEERMRPGSAHTADLAIRYKGILWYVDVQVTCPATAAQVNEGSHLERLQTELINASSQSTPQCLGVYATAKDDWSQCSTFSRSSWRLAD